MFKIKDGYKIELQTPETMQLFGSTNKLIDKTNSKSKTVKVPSIEVTEVVLNQCHIVYNQYQQKYKVIYTLTPNES